MTNKNPIYLAIDSDVLRTLTLLDILKKEHSYVDIDKIKDSSLKKDFNYFNRLYNALNHDEIRPLIVDAVYQESKHSASLVNFMKNHCYFPKINLVNYQEKATEARELANAYCSPFKLGGKEFPAPMKKVFHADENKHAPSNDCYIMAQATIEGICLITANGQDFIFDDKSNIENHFRSMGIINVNMIKGYCSGDVKKYGIPRPYHIETIGPMIKQTLKFSAFPAFNEFEKGNDLIT